jgi:hypothetical protein
MGEVLDKAKPGDHLQLAVKHVDNHLTGIFFHDRHKGAEFSDISRNDTVVVLYAQRGGSEAGAVVKVRNTSTVKV